MKIGLVTNSELCLQLLQHLSVGGHDVRLYLGSHSAENHKIAVLLSFCENASIRVTKETIPDDLYSWLRAEKFARCFIYYYNSRVDLQRPEVESEKIFNIHAGRLPYYRGSWPVFWQLRNGESSIGVCIHLLAQRFDAGPIVWEKQFANLSYFTTGNVHSIVGSVLAEGLDFVINTTPNILLQAAVEQDENQACVYRKPSFRDVVVKWDEMDAEVVTDLVKACRPWNFGAWTYFNYLPMTIIDAEPLAEITGAPPGMIIEADKNLKVACAGGSILQVNFLRVNEDFINTRHAEKFGFLKGLSFLNPPETTESF